MKSVIFFLGKTNENYLSEGISEYEKRIKKYIPFEILTIPNIKNTKNLSENEQKEKEGELISKKFQSGDYIILLDAKGKLMDSETFANWLIDNQMLGYKRLVFVIGGAYGFSSKIYEKANVKISISPMTFSHQIIRLIFMEQYYRAYTILNGEPYHH